jgi:Copper amine oxidase, enzyme domain
MRTVASLGLIATFGIIASAPAPIRSANAGEIVQYFPASPDGQPSPRPESGWRITYSILKPSSIGNCIGVEQDYGCAEVLELQGVEFMRGYKPSGEEDWIRVLNRLALAELVVVYNSGFTMWDVYENKSLFKRQIVSGDIAGPGVIRREVSPEGVVAEVIDDHVRWATGQSGTGEPGRIRRGQLLDLWAVWLASNYTYLIRYSFTDDGTIRIRVGATGHNWRNLSINDDEGIHVHVPVWRLEFDLGAPAANTVEVVERRAPLRDPSARMVHRPFNRGMEGGEVWRPERFTNLMIRNDQFQNRHEPPHRIGYKLLPIRLGSIRSHQATRRDFWVSRIRPDNADRAADRELRFQLLPSYIQYPEPITHHAVAIWYSAPFQHIPRTEDFGPRQYRTNEGLALTMFSGFDLIPHNIWDRTPFYQPEIFELK